jgi:hypothetical protein
MTAPSYADSPGVWRGRELFADPDWSSAFSASELDELERCARATGDLPFETLGADALPLPGVGPRLTAVQQSLEHGPGAVLLRALPVGRWGEAVTTRVFWAVASHLGVPLSQSAAGERLFHVRDHGYAPDDARFRGPASSKRLSFHTDRCDVIAFACLRPAETGGENFIISSVALYEELRAHHPEALTLLREPFPYLRHTVDTGNTRPFCRLPVFSAQDGHFAAHFLRVLIDRADRAPDAPTLTGPQRAALDLLETVAEDPALHVQCRLEPGDILLLNNWTTFHRRSAFTDAPGPADRRHLLRIWLSVPNSRPIAPCFRDHFGATGAGAVRGGMRPAGA